MYQLHKQDTEIVENGEYYIAYNENSYEILNCNDKMKKTGYYFEDVTQNYGGANSFNSAVYQYNVYNGNGNYYITQSGIYIQTSNDNLTTFINSYDTDMLFGMNYVVDYMTDDEKNNYIIDCYDSITNAYRYSIYDYGIISNVMNNHRDDIQRELSDNNGWCYPNCILYRYYQREEYVTECELHYSISQNITIDEIAKNLWYRPDNEDDPLNNVYEYYQMLCQNDTLSGNHQTIISPIQDIDMNTLVFSNRIFNQYGYDVQHWNERHCGLNTPEKIINHTAIDITCAINEKLLCPMDAKIVSIDKNSDTIVLETEKNILLWDKKESKVRITLRNVYPLQHKIDESSPNMVEYKAGDIVKQGTQFAYATPSYNCYDGTNVGAEHFNSHYCYICMQIQVSKSTSANDKENKNYVSIDPMLFVY